MTDLTDYVTIIEAARELRLHPETVKRLCRQGDIQAIKFRNAWLIHRESLDAFSRGYNPGRGPGSRFRRIQEEAVRYLPRQLKFDAGDEDR
ncbi:MAG: helix-turn-helix domain-containing protein [Chloroflexi bacterium]|nr:helix-turn-helix domain-containing protein [Chloroflexota bacterium]